MPIFQLNTIQKKIAKSSTCCMILIGLCVIVFAWLSLSALASQSAEELLVTQNTMELTIIKEKISEGLLCANMLSTYFSVNCQNHHLSRDDAMKLFIQILIQKQEYFGYFIAFEPNVLLNHSRFQI